MVAPETDRSIDPPPLFHAMMPFCALTDVGPAPVNEPPVIEREIVPALGVDALPSTTSIAFFCAPLISVLTNARDVVSPAPASTANPCPV